MIEEVLKPVGELISLSNEITPHERFISALIRQRHGISLPINLNFIFGMQRYQVLIIGENCALPKYCWDLGLFVLLKKYRWDLDLFVLQESHKVAIKERGYLHDIPPEEKGKN